MTRLYHITSRSEAENAATVGEYVPQTFEAEGFIHCSYAHQVVAVANRRYRGCTDLVLLEVDCAKLSCEVVDENLDGGTQLFPHIYGRLPMSAVVAVHNFPCDEDGRFHLPSHLRV